ncbi:MAG: TolB family protein [bacterium]
MKVGKRDQQGDGWILRVLILAAVLAVVSAGPPAWAGPQPTGGSDQIAYVDSKNVLWLSEWNGARKKRLVGADKCIPYSGLLWSPVGDRLACYREERAHVGPSDFNQVTIVHIARGLLRNIQWVGGFDWSPTGRHMAYEISTRGGKGDVNNLFVADADGRVRMRVDRITGSFAWSPDGTALAYATAQGRIRLYEVATNRRRHVAAEFDSVLAWVQGGAALIVGKRMGYDLDHFLIELSTGKVRGLGWLDNRHYWLSSDGRRVVFTGDNQLNIVELSNLRMISIEGSTYRTLGDGDISVWSVGFSRASQVYWLDYLGSGSTAIYRAQSDGSGLTRLATLPGLGLEFSPDLSKVAYTTHPTDILWTATIEGTIRHKIGPVPKEGDSVSWRPVVRQ